MQPVYTPPNTRNITFQQGLIFGLILGLVSAVILLLNTFVISPSGNGVLALLLSFLVFLLGLAAYFVAGILASKKTGKVSTGTFAGLWTGAIYGIIGFIVSMVLFFTVNLAKILDAAKSSTLNPDAFRTGAIIGGVGFAIFGILFAVGLGAGLGSLGGLICKNTSKVAAAPAYPPYPNQPSYPPYQNQLYPPQANPGQPYTHPSGPYPANPYQPDPGQSYFEQPP